MFKSILHCSLLAALLAGFTPASADAAGAAMAGRRLSIGGGNISESFYVGEYQTRTHWDWRTNSYTPGEVYLYVVIVDKQTGETLVRKSFPKDDVVLIILFAGGGDDDVEIDTDMRSSLHGEEGDDFILGGHGDDFIDAGPGILDYIDGRGGDDVLYSGNKWIFPLVSSPYTEMHGGPGNDTFIYRNSDILYMDNFSGPGWMIAPDYTFGGNNEQYAGMHLIME